MRNILFRGKDEDTKEWLYGFYTQFRHPKYLEMKYCICTEKSQYKKVMGVIPETVGQFTGLTDKNGKEIYEGDILCTKFEDKNEEKGYYKVYNEVSFQFGAYGFIGEITGEFLPFSIYPIEKEIVIGNIYDNPELLTNKE